MPSQKLIYRGQLLRNTQQLSDVAKDSEVRLCHCANLNDKDKIVGKTLSFSVPQQVVIHLVAYERSASAPVVRVRLHHLCLILSVLSSTV